ncbi:hypothetical protein PBI_INGRID_62 [Arthrobacter phage Ingrid]|nr:hypothetical protein PBI_INGRID_62 [Arthrobacter phage Ingrid]QFG11041.1 hypothetical protein PBI_LORETTA_59 [Arthrobacter phage Loretta]
MKNLKRFAWLLRMTPWVFKHAYHAPNHQVNGSSIEKNFVLGYFRCRRCQETLTVPSYISN